MDMSEPQAVCLQARFLPKGVTQGIDEPRGNGQVASSPQWAEVPSTRMNTSHQVEETFQLPKSKPGVERDVDSHNLDSEKGRHRKENCPKCRQVQCYVETSTDFNVHIVMCTNETQTSIYLQMNHILESFKMSLQSIQQVMQVIETLCVK